MWDSISRVSVDAKNGYWWINLVGIALTVTVAGMSIAAYGEAEQPERAVLCVMAQIVAIAAAILARRSFTGHMPIAGAVVLVFAGGCAYWSSHGLALSWYGDATQLGPEVVFLALLEPGLFLLAEHIKEGRAALAAAEAKTAAEAAAALAEAKERDERNRRLDDERRAAEASAREAVVEDDKVVSATTVQAARTRKRTRQAARAAVAVLAGTAAVGGAQAVEPAGVVQAAQLQNGSRMVDFDEIDRAREALARRGIKPSQRTVANHLGVSKYRIEQVWPKGQPLTDGLENTWDVAIAS